MSHRRDPAVEALADALDRGLARAQKAIDQAARRNASLLDTVSRHTGEPWFGQLAREGTGPSWAGAGEKLAELIEQGAHGRHARRMERELERRLAKRQMKERFRAERRKQNAELRAARLAETHLGEGVVALAAALVMAAVALVQRELWWMIFPALGIGAFGGRVVTAKLAARTPRSLPSSDGSATALDPRDARVDAVCTQIQAELKSAPEAVKELVGHSGKTIAQLRTTCRHLTQRERELRRWLNPDDDARLAGERDALVQRIAGESDDVVRARLQSALEQLEQQRRERAQLGTAAARFEAEHTRMAYTLESLHTQILRLKSADSAAHDPASAAVRQSLAQLGEEIDAVAEALEVEGRDPAARARDRA